MSGREAEGPFAVSRSLDEIRHRFSARDAAAGVTIPTASRVEAYALVSSLNRAVAHHVALATPRTDAGEVERLREALHKIANVRPIGGHCHSNSVCSVMEGIAISALAAAPSRAGDTA